MPVFKAPQYSKVLNPKTNIQEPCHTFNIEFNDDEDGLTFVAEDESEISLKTLQTTVQENCEWWNTFVDKYLQASSKLFSKPYTVEHINKIAKHTLDGDKPEMYPVNVVVFPKNIRIMSGTFTINWTYRIERVLIDIPDLSDADKIVNELVEEPPVSEKVVETPTTGASISTSDIRELNAEDLEFDKNSTGDNFQITSPSKFFDKQRVKEARLKAKLAIYKAQRQMIQYSEKYGSDISDSDTDTDTESDYETTGGVTHTQEVQL